MVAVQELSTQVNPIVEELGGIEEFQRLWRAAQTDDVNRHLAKPREEAQVLSYLNNDVPNNIVQLLLKVQIGSRDMGHLMRLLNGGKDEYDFAVTLLKQRTLIEAQEDIVFHEVYRGEDANTVMWYTLAPSLLSLLREKGITDRDSLMILMNWTATKSRKYDDYPTLDGLKELKPYIPTFRALRSFVLGKEPDGPSHVFARTLSTQLLKHGSFFQKQLQTLNESSSQAAT